MLVGGGPQLDLDEAAFRRAMQSFGTELQGADVGLFYYAGHGVQVRGGNSLVPVPTEVAGLSLSTTCNSAHVMGPFSYHSLPSS